MCSCVEPTFGLCTCVCVCVCDCVCVCVCVCMCVCAYVCLREVRFVTGYMSLFLCVCASVCLCVSVCCVHACHTVSVKPPPVKLRNNQQNALYQSSDV